MKNRIEIDKLVEAYKVSKENLTATKRILEECGIISTVDGSIGMVILDLNNRIKSVAKKRIAELALEEEKKSDEPNGAICGLCKLPMPKGEEMFLYHGHSGPCPTPTPSGGTIIANSTPLRKVPEK